MRAPAALLVLLSALAACGSKPDEAREESPMKVEDTVFGDMTQTMDRARSVESTTMEHKEALDRALEADER